MGYHGKTTLTLKHLKIKNKDIYMKSIVEENKSVKTTKIKKIEYKNAKEKFQDLLERLRVYKIINSSNCTERIEFSGANRQSSEFCLDQAQVEHKKLVTDYIKNHFYFK